MNNTLSHSSLSYSHPSCALHHPSHSPFIQQNVAHTATSSHPQISNCFTNAAVTQQNMSAQVSNNARLNQASQLQAIQKHPNSFPHHSHNHHNVSNVGLPIHLSACNLPVTNNSSMFTQTSVYINPYMGVPYPMTHTHYAHQHPSLLPAHMHPHHYIAPPVGFNVSQTSNSSNNCSSQVSPSVSNCYSSRASVAVNKPAASTVHYATEPGNHSYAGVPSTATGALVPYNVAGLSVKSPSPMLSRYMSVPKSSAEGSLFTKLQKTHLSYLNTEDSPEKLELRKEMDELIQNLVSVTPHKLKFGFSEVQQVLEESVRSQPHFDAFKAASAFEALASYATNLVMQPWRREYWSIKLYCGYWVHQVSSHLHCPELILRTMGYETASGGDSSFELLGGMADADIVARLALDCHVACGECQVLGQLQQQVPQLSYAQLLQYRQISTGTIHHTALSLQHCFRTADEEDEQGTDGRDAKGDQELSLVSERQVVAAADQTVATLPDRQLVQSSDLCDGPPRPVPRSYNLHRSSSRLSLDDEKISIKSKQVGEQQPDRLMSPSHGQEGGFRSAGRLALDLSTPHSFSSGRLLPATSSSRYPESPDGRPSRPERGREGGGSSRRQDDHGSGTGGGAVATARLIDHEEQQQQQTGSTGRRTGGGRTEGGAPSRHSRHCLPQVLPHLRSSHKSNAALSDSSGGNLFHLSESPISRHLFPSEVFEDSTFEEHLRESYALLKQEQQQQQQRASCSGGSNGSSYKDTWGFVMSDLEKKGYNKDVGNRGDILQHSRPSSTNVSTSITVANTPATLVCSSGRLAAEQRNTIVSSVSRPLIPSTIRSSSNRRDVEPLIPNTMRNSRQDASVLIPSTVQNGRQLSPSPPPPLPSRPYPAASSTLSMNDALEQLDLNLKPAVLVPSVSSSSSSSCGGGTARIKSRANERYRAEQSRYSSTADKFSSNSTGVAEDNTTDKRNSMYDNVSYEGFETARQDTDEEDDGIGRGMMGRRGEYCRQGEDVAGRRHHMKQSPPSCGSISSSDSVSNMSRRYTNALESSNPSMTVLSKRSPLTHISSKAAAQHLLHSTEDLHRVAAHNTSSKQPTGTGSHRNSSSSSSTSGDAPVASESLMVFPWSCETCTYANERERLVCEMCGRSRAPPCERVPAAGRACGQCTLINEEEALSCQACGYSLEAAHAYV